MGSGGDEEEEGRKAWRVVEERKLGLESDAEKLGGRRTEEEEEGRRTTGRVI